VTQLYQTGYLVLCFGTGRERITIVKMHAQTQRQREVLDFILRYIDSHGYRPSYQVIAREMGVRSRAGIARIVSVLESQGLLTRRRENGHFYIDLGDPGGVSAGSSLIDWLEIPIAESDLEPWQREPIMVPNFMIGVQAPDRVRAYQIADNGLRGENICDGDIGLVELRQFARDGERVVAVLEDKTSVLRRYYRKGSEVELRAVDHVSDIAAIRLAADRVAVKGVLRALLRHGI
jgi:repressor LexA